MSKVLVFGDIHEPFSKDGYLSFLKKTYEKYNCNKVVCTGDIIDLHSISFHEPEPEAMGAIAEVTLAKKKLKKIYEAFPKVEYIYGNHDLRIQRKAAKVGISSTFIREVRDILEMPKGWSVHPEYCIIDNVKYKHGEGYSGMNGGRNAAIDSRMSTVIGHLHAHTGLAYIANDHELIWGMNVGSGVDNTAYAMKYGKTFRFKPVVSCGVVINGKPYIEAMDLGSRIVRVSDG